VSALNKQEMQIVQVFSAMTVPEKLFKDSNIKNLIQNMIKEQDAVAANARLLESARQDKRDGNFVGNWWNDRDDKVQDAQLELSTSIGRLTEKSSQLLIVNTAISKVLSEQQGILQEQQHLLKEQADQLAMQNGRILGQQERLAEQQTEINAANRGLMEAKGLTQEQAKRLVGCVVRVTEAEQKMELANAALQRALGEQLDSSVAQCLARLDTGFAEVREFHRAGLARVDDAAAAGTRLIEIELDRLAASHARFTDDAQRQQKAQAQAIRKHAESHVADMCDLREETATRLMALAETITNTVEGAVAARLQAMQEVLAQQDRELKQHAQDLATQGEATQAASRSGRLATAGVAALALLSLGWQVAGQFAR